MDFPKSVPGVGLVGGEFVDEDASIGRQGSLIPAEWGNAVTREILNVVDAADLTPDEQQHDQLLQAIRRLVGELSVTGTATLTGTDNKIVMPLIASKLKLEKGDVIQIKITGATTYDKLHTVESILNTGEIVVNYEHCGARGNGRLKLPNYSGSVTVKRIAKYFNAANGLGQEFVNVSNFRTVGESYLNSTGRVIGCSFLCQTITAANISENGLVIQRKDYVAGVGVNNPVIPIDLEVSSGATYAYGANGTVDQKTIFERR